jgi:predicted PurR-regulated permease PerM
MADLVPDPQRLRRNTLLVLAVLLIALAPFVWVVLRPFILSFFVAVVGAIVIYPIHLPVARRLRNPGFAALVTTSASAVLVSAFIGVMVAVLTREIADAYAALNRMSEAQGGWPALVTHASDRALEIIGDRLPIDKEAVRANLLAYLKNVASFVLKAAGAVVRALTSSIITGILAAIFLYFLLRHGERWVERAVVTVPVDPETTRRLIRTVQDAVIANVNGVLAVAFSQGLLLALAFWAAGLRSPVLWGLVGGIASIIPIIGAVILWAPIAIGLALTGAYWKAALLALWCALVVGSADNIVRPAVVGGRIQQHPVLIALSMIGGTEAFGPPGVLLGPVIVALVAAAVAEIQRALRPR